MEIRCEFSEPMKSLETDITQHANAGSSSGDMKLHCKMKSQK